MNLLTGTPVEAAIIIACALEGPRDLLCLARACRHFATKCIAAPAAHHTAASGGATAAAQQAEMWSIAEEVARWWIASCTDQERGWVPRRGRESWLGLMWEVEVLRRGVVFGRSHVEIALSEGGVVAKKGMTASYENHVAASKVVMRAGRHYAQFAVVSGRSILFGVIRPGWDVEGGKDAFLVNGHCFYETYHGAHYPAPYEWEGMQGAKEEGDRVGLLLDLDQGTMTAYKNDKWLGVMATGLSGENCWVVLLYKPGGPGGLGDGARIEAAEVPAGPRMTQLP